VHSSPILSSASINIDFVNQTECIGTQGSPGYSTRKSDVWSLGVIIANMITGRLPWVIARADDQCFMEFVKNPDYLLQVLPISKGMNEIFKKIFVLEPSFRITLPELYREILNLDTFFISDEDYVHASEYVRNVRKMYATCEPEPRTVLQVRNYTSSDDSSDYDDSDAIRRVDMAWAGHVDSRILRAGAGRSVDITEFARNEASSDSSSSDESDGPITPETHAVDPAIAIPDFEEGEDIGKPVLEVVNKGLGDPITDIVERLVAL
jgi:serine/threonine protein kinase